MKTFTTWAVMLSFCIAFCLFSPHIHAQPQSDVYDSGSVWTLSTIRIDANMDDEYLTRLRHTWLATMDEAKKEELVLDYKILKGQASNKEDFNLLLMVEFSNMASLDPDAERDAKWNAIRERVSARPDFKEIVQSYGEMRQLFGQKMMREIYLK